MIFKTKREKFDIKMKKIRSIIKSHKWRKEVGEFIVNMIQVRTRLGFGVDKMGGKKDKLLKLSDSYKKFRKLHPPTGFGSTPTKSNLTYTGEMIESIVVELTDKTIKLDLKDDTQRQKAEWNKENKREFLLLSKAEIKQVEQFIYKKLKEEFDKLK